MTRTRAAILWRLRYGAWLVPPLLAAACARPPRPSAMADSERAQKAPGSQDAATWAPEAFAHAEKLRRDAEAAYRGSDLAGAQLLSERASAAYQHAVVLARIARANRAALDARAALDVATQKLAENEGENRRIAAEADDLELRVKVAHDAVPLTPSGAAGDAAREQARLAAARSLALDARLLCAGARLLDAKASGLADGEKAADDVEKRLHDAPHPAPIDPATRARAQCLSALTAARRPANAASSVGQADNLLAELSAMGDLAPERDDRGVVVTLGAPFQGEALTEAAEKHVRTLGKVAAAHPAFPIALVVHAKRTTSTKDLTSDRARGDRVAKLLVESGAAEGRIVVQPGGAWHPLVPSSAGKGADRNERIEIIFVDPGG